MGIRSQITVDPELQRRAEIKATELGISFAEYVRRLLARDLGPPRRVAEVSLVFDLVDEGPATNIAANKDQMIGEAVWHEHMRTAGEGRKTRARLKIKRS